MLVSWHARYLTYPWILYCRYEYSGCDIKQCQQLTGAFILVTFSDLWSQNHAFPTQFSNFYLCSIHLHPFLKWKWHFFYPLFAWIFFSHFPLRLDRTETMVADVERVYVKLLIQLVVTTASHTLCHLTLCGSKHVTQPEKLVLVISIEKNYYHNWHTPSSLCHLWVALKARWVCIQQFKSIVPPSGPFSCALLKITSIELSWKVV